LVVGEPCGVGERTKAPDDRLNVDAAAWDVWAGRGANILEGAATHAAPATVCAPTSCRPFGRWPRLVTRPGMDTDGRACRGPIQLLMA
jgi:hypothetical protein